MNSQPQDHTQIHSDSRSRIAIIAACVVILVTASMFIAQQAFVIQNFYLPGIALALSCWLIYRERHIFDRTQDTLEEPAPIATSVDENQKLAVNFQSTGKLNAAFTLFKQCAPS